MTTAQQLGMQIKAARNKAGLSIRGLGTLANIPASTVEGYEAGTKIPAENFLRLADALKHHTSKLMATNSQSYEQAQQLPHQQRVNN
jgi:predicted transcriptional regulator